MIYSHASYGDNEDCEWIIELDNVYDSSNGGDNEEGSQADLGGGADLHIQLTFLSFEIEDENDCAFDFVELFEGDDPGGSSTRSVVIVGTDCPLHSPPPQRGVLSSFDLKVMTR